MNNITKAKVQLVYDHPFFATLLLGMALVEDKSCQTMATDGETIFFNSEYMSTLTLPETTFILAHEVMHAVFEHAFSIGEKDAENWNIATDLVINGLLVKEKLGRMPKGGLLDDAFVSKGNGTAEGVYRLLPAKPKDNSPKPDNGLDGAPLDDLRKPSGDDSQLSDKQTEMKVKVSQACDVAKMAGNLSAELARLVDDIIKTETDWRSVLRRFFTERAKETYSFARPKRRFLGDDLYLPSLVGERLGSIVVAVDCSGSIDGASLARFNGELSGIVEDTRPSQVKVVYFDSKVLKVETFGPDDTFKLSPIGGGGTAFSPIFESINADDTAPTAVIVLTDLACDDFGPMPDYPVLWASTDTRRDAVPFGEVTLIRETKGRRR
jgi:predicted metal-dependent peptidase